MPLIEMVGNAWASGTIRIRQEHAFSERLGDVLRTLRMPYESRADGPLVLLATLPGELHGLGLQMAALVVALAGGRPDVLGTSTPLEEIVSSCRARRPDAVGISISSSSAGPQPRRALARLRSEIPAAIPVFAGGRGAAASSPRKGVEVVTDLAALYDWARRAGARRRRSGP
jgi:methanogenic corrinoid protein MtbC1